MDGRRCYQHVVTATACLALLASCCFAAEPVAPRQRVYGPIARLPAADDFGDDLLTPAPHAPHSVQPKPPTTGDEANAKQLAPGEDPHAACFATTDYPSATTCAECHKQIYDEWRVSSHAYASISPMFHKFEQTITELSRGTVGHP